MKILNSLLLVIGLAILVGFVLLFKVDLSVFLDVKQPEFVVYAFILQFISFVVISWRIGLFVNAMQKVKMLYKEMFEIEFANKFVYYIFPTRINVAAKAFFIDKIFKTGKQKALSITILEYTIDTFILIVLSLYGLIFLFKGLPGEYLFQVSAIGAIIVLGLIIYFLLPQGFFNFFKNLASKLPIGSNLAVKGVEFTSNARKVWLELMTSKMIIPILLIMGIYWAIQIFSIQLFFLAYNAVPPTLVETMAVYALALLVSGIPQTPGGIGVREAAFGYLFSLVGSTIEIGIAVALLFRLFTLIPIVIGYFAAVKLGFNKKLFGANKNEAN